jgi:hypothetical protein
MTNTDNPQDKYIYDIGWLQAIDMVIDVIQKMQDSKKFDNLTLDELAQRIV